MFCSCQPDPATGRRRGGGEPNEKAPPEAGLSGWRQPRQRQTSRTPYGVTRVTQRRGATTRGATTTGGRTTTAGPP